MAGVIKVEPYANATNLIVTNLHSLASSSNFQGGWTSGALTNRTLRALDRLYALQLFLGTSPTAGREVRAYVYSAMGHVDGTPTWPDLFSSGTEGVEGAVTLHDPSLLDSPALRLLASWPTVATTNLSIASSLISIWSRLGFVPSDYAIYITHNSVAALKSSGNLIKDTPDYLGWA